MPKWGYDFLPLVLTLVLLLGETSQEFEKDNGDWLSAQQAVRPDGSEVTNLPLINKKLPPLVKPSEQVEPIEAEATLSQTTLPDGSELIAARWR